MLYLLLWSANWQLVTGVSVSVIVYCLVDYVYILLTLHYLSRIDSVPTDVKWIYGS